MVLRFCALSLLLLVGCQSFPGSSSPANHGGRWQSCDSGANGHGSPSMCEAPLADYGESKSGNVCATPARPACLPAAPPAAPQRVIIEVVQHGPAAPVAMPPAAAPVAMPAPAFPQAPPLPPALPPGWQSVPAAPAPYSRVGLTLGWCHLPIPYPRLQPVQVQPEAPTVNVPVQLQPSAVAMVPAAPALPVVPQQYANVPVTGTALVPVAPGPACAPPLAALPPAACAQMPPRLPEVRADAAAELVRQMDALRAAMDAAAAGAKK